MSQGAYARIRKSFWTDTDVRTTLTAEQRLLFLYYFSGPHSTMTGLYWCPFTYAANETGLALGDVRLWTHTSLAPFLTYDEKTEEVFVHAAAVHQISSELAEKDKRRGAIEREWHTVRSPLLKARFCERYATWGLKITAPTVPAGYQRLVSALPPVNVDKYPCPLNAPSEPPVHSSAVQCIAEQDSTGSSPLRYEEPGDQGRGLDVEDSGATPPSLGDELPPVTELADVSFTQGQLLAIAREKCGLNRWNRDEEKRSRSVLLAWYGDGRSPDSIHAAIQGFAILRDSGGSWAEKGESYGLRALNNTRTVFDQGNGEGVLRLLFDVAEEAYIKSRDAPAPRSQRGGVKSVSELLEAKAS